MGIDLVAVGVPVDVVLWLSIVAAVVAVVVLLGLFVSVEGSNHDL